MNSRQKEFVYNIGKLSVHVENQPGGNLPEAWWKHQPPAGIRLGDIMLNSSA